MSNFGIKTFDIDRLSVDNRFNPTKFGIKENTQSLALYNWQRRAKEFFIKYKYALFEIPTGGGKTFFAINLIKYIINKHPDYKILIVVPKNIILEKVWFNDMFENGISFKDIGVYYGSIKEESKITITNMQNLKNINVDDYQVLIYDELHWGGSKSNLKYLYKKFEYKIGLTATLERLDNKHYDILEAFNYNHFKYDIKEAIADNVINMFNFYPIGLYMDKDFEEEYNKICKKIDGLYKVFGGYKVIMRGKDFRLKSNLLGLLNSRKKLVNNYKRKIDVLIEVLKKIRGQKVLVFNQNNKTTNNLYWILLENDFKAEVIHSGVTKDKRATIINQYEANKFDILLTSKVLDEGYSLPAINAVIIMSNDSGGKRQLIQRIGRALRKKKDGSLSDIYYVYVKDTIEEVESNLKLLKELATDMYEQTFKPNETVILK